MQRLPGCTLLVAAALFGAVGCYSIPHSGWEGEIAARPDCARDNVHIVFIESPVDVLRVGRCDAIAERVRCLGYRNTHYFNPYHHGDHHALAKKIKSIRECHPEGKIAVVGWSMGCVYCVNALDLIEDDNCCCGPVIDSVIHLDSFVLPMYLWTMDHPQNAERVVFINRTMTQLPDSPPANSVVYWVEEQKWNHLACPTRPKAYNALLCELARLTAESHLCEGEQPPANAPPATGELKSVGGVLLPPPPATE